MNGVDYSKALARERDQYQNSIQKDRAHSAKVINDQEERHEAIQKKQFNNFEKDRSELEEDYKTNISGIQERTKESIETQRERFHKANAEEQERFHAEREGQRKDFDSRFRDIKESYTRAHDNKEKFHKTVAEEQKERYDQNVERLIKDKDKKIGEFSDRLKGTGSDMKEQYKHEKNQLVRAHEQHLEGVYKDEGQKRFMLKEGLKKDIDRTKEAYAADKDQAQTYMRDKVKTLSENFNNRAEKISSDYEKKNGEVVEKQARENFVTNKDHQHQLAEARRNYEKDIRNIEIDRRRRDNGSGEYSEIVKRQQGLKDDQIYEDRINRLKDNLTAANLDYNDRTTQASEDYKTTLLNENVNAANRLERKEKELMADKIVNVSNEREKAQKLHNVQSASQLAERQRYEGQILTERKGSNTQIKKLKENFNESLNNLQERNDKFMTDMKKETTAERSKFVTEANLKRNEEILELRRNFNKLMNTTSTEYETRLADASRENSQLKDELDQKVGFVMAEADREKQILSQKFQDKSVADRKSMEALMDTREANFRNKILEVSTNYQKKIDQLSYGNEMKMKQTVNQYETKLKEKDALLLKTVAEKDTSHSTEIKNLKLMLEQEKAQVIAQYENQMNQLKVSQQVQIDQLNEYKKMG